MTLPHDPLEALSWAWNHVDRAWWLIVAIGAGIAWTNKRMREWSRRNALSVGPAKARPAGWTPGAPSPSPPASVPAAPPAAPKPGAAPAYTAATAYAASAYAGQAAYAPPPPTAASHGSQARKVQRDAPAQRAVTPVARSVDVPVATGVWTLAGAFGDPAHARTAIVIAEVLGPPPGLR